MKYSAAVKAYHGNSFFSKAISLSLEDNQIGTFWSNGSNISATSAIVGNGVGGQGTISLVASILRLNNLTINATGQVSMINTARIIATSIDNNHGGSFDFRRGVLTVETFTGDLVNQGGTLAPSNLLSDLPAGSTTIVGDYIQQANARLTIDIGGVLQANEYDSVNVTGSVLLDGDLQLSLIDDFVPQATDTFTILDDADLTQWEINYGGADADADGDLGSIGQMHFKGNCSCIMSDPLWQKGSRNLLLLMA